MSSTYQWNWACIVHRLSTAISWNIVSIMRRRNVFILPTICERSGTCIHAGSKWMRRYVDEWLCCIGQWIPLIPSYSLLEFGFIHYELIQKDCKLEISNYRNDCIWLITCHWHTGNWAAMDGELVSWTLVQIVSHWSFTTVVWASQFLLSSISSACDHLVNVVVTPLPSTKEGILPFSE